MNHSVVVKTHPGAVWNIHAKFHHNQSMPVDGIINEKLSLGLLFYLSFV